jgi:hypothetical protein
VAQATVRVKGQKELVRALGKIDKNLKREVQQGLSEAATVVASDARSRFANVDVGSAAGFRPRVRGASAFVGQRKRRTTGKRGDYGALQMRRALIPALESKQEEVVGKLDRMLGRLGGEAGF